LRILPVLDSAFLAYPVSHYMTKKLDR